MPTKHDVRRIALEQANVTEKKPDSFHFILNGRNMIWPYPEKVHPKKPRVLRYDQFLFRIADDDDKLALLAGEPDIFFTADHYDGYNAVIVRLDAIDEDRLRELIEMAAEAAPLSTRS